ncbi:hypothetical protein HPB50_009471 [Hyalomma asiaticum]|uniref:Uncharacterized protein n=1 Tax=Hyalomma asiaticum TaxID=266040 RepID=A0ACB7T6D2_HYAAI|nr:hypothetical protein HPB50_009471 [Hyalomma asiaticum]
MLSYAHGVRSFVSIKQSGLDGTVVLSFSRPFSAYVNGSTVRELFEGTVQLLEIPRHVRSQTVDHLLLADQELATSLSEVSSFHVTIPGLTNATEGNVASSAWKKIFQDYASHKADVPMSAPVASAEALKQVLMILFDKLHPREAAAYAMAHALLPTQVIEVLLEEHRTDACFRLVGDIFSTSWQDLESYLLGFFDENREAQSVADSLVSTLKKMLEERSTLDKQKSDAAIARLKQLSFDLPSIEGLVNTVPSTTCRGNLTDNSLYWNLARCRATSHSVARAVNETRGRRERSSLPTTTIVLPVESLRPSYFCHGHVSLLNYATLGTELAAMLLRYIAESSHGAASSHSTAEWLKEALIQGITHNISTCLSKSSSQPLGRLLDEVALQTVAFQLALRASKSGSRASAWARIENAADAPAWKQTYFVKYCQRLCSKGVSHSLTTTLDAALVCNAVVMNSPEFARLFRCERGDSMVPSEYCLAV